MQEKFTVIFDFDGTLANTLELVFRLYNENASVFGARQVGVSELDDYRKLGYKKAMKKAGIRWSVLPRLVLFVSREMKKHMSEVSPYEGVISQLQALQNEGVSIGVLTSNDAGLVQEFFKAHNFPVFDFVVSEKTMFGKEKALKRIMKRHNLDPQEVVYVGDEPRDIVACRKAHIKVVGVTWGFGGREGLLATPPDALIDTTDQLKTAIFSLKK